MYPVTNGTVETGLEITETAYIFLLTEKAYPPFSDLCYESLDIGVRAMIIDDLYLHFAWSRILGQYTQ
jgi:hypothetical protein